MDQLNTLWKCHKPFSYNYGRVSRQVRMLTERYLDSNIHDPFIDSKDIFHQAYVALVPDKIPIRSIPIRILGPEQPLLQLPIPVKEHMTLGQLALNYLSRSVGHQRFEAWMQGIVIHEKDYDLTLDKLYQEFAHPDGFLYLCFKPQI